MKSILSNSCCKKKEKPFPKLMKKPNGTIVLMFDEKKGTAVHACAHDMLGYPSTHAASAYEDYKGDVCLTNSED